MTVHQPAYPPALRWQPFLPLARCAQYVWKAPERKFVPCSRVGLWVPQGHPRPVLCTRHAWRARRRLGIQFRPSLTARLLTPSLIQYLKIRRSQPVQRRPTKR